MPHRIETLGLRIRESPAHRQALRIFGDRNRQRAKAKYCVRSDSHFAFDGDHVGESAVINHARCQPQQQTGIIHRHQRRRCALRHHQLEHFHPDPLGGQA